MLINTTVGHGKACFGLRKHGRDFRHDKRHEKKQHRDADDQHEGRIEDGIRHFVFEGQLFFQKLSEAEQDLIQRSAGFTGPHHVHIDLGELARVASPARRCTTYLHGFLPGYRR